MLSVRGRAHIPCDRFELVNADRDNRAALQPSGVYLRLESLGDLLQMDAHSARAGSLAGHVDESALGCATAVHLRPQLSAIPAVLNCSSAFSYRGLHLHYCYKTLFA
jgi:hypothetical protein